MDRFARQVLGYHGCSADFAREVLAGTKEISAWEPSENEYDWLGRGIYFWEHSPWRALRWAQESCGRKGGEPAVIGAVIQLGECFDLLNEAITSLLVGSYEELKQAYLAEGLQLPQNRGLERKLRDLDCLVINNCLDRLKEQGKSFDTVRGAFPEGDLAYPGAGFASETHIQIAVRDPTCILGVFRPNLSI